MLIQAQTIIYNPYESDYFTNTELQFHPEKIIDPKGK